MTDVHRYVCAHPFSVSAFRIQRGSVMCQTLAVCSSNTFALDARQMYVHVSTYAHAQKWNWHTITCLFNPKGWSAAIRPLKIKAQWNNVPWMWLGWPHMLYAFPYIYINIYPTYVLFFCTLFVWRTMSFTSFCIDFTLLFLLLGTVW